MPQLAVMVPGVSILIKNDKELSIMMHYVKFVDVCIVHYCCYIRNSSSGHRSINDILLTYDIIDILLTLMNDYFMTTSTCISTFAV